MKCLLVGLLLLAAACSGGSITAHKSARDLATALSCTGFQQETTALFEREEGSCSFRGENVTISTFTDSTAEDNWRKASSSFGIGPIVVGPNWIIQPDTEDGAKAIQAKMGGTIH